jgi:hypothetical protein
MAGIQDFRTTPFSRPRVEACGRFLGHRSYWKLYSIENYFRVILHSVLTVQIGPKWLESSVDRDTKARIDRIKKDYLKRAIHGSPGRHDIYYLYLSDLTKIMAASRHLIEPVIFDVDSWIIKMENVRIPRNLVGHMNFPSLADRNRIDTLHGELTALLQKLERQPGLRIVTP